MSGKKANGTCPRFRNPCSARRLADAIGRSARLTGPVPGGPFARAGNVSLVSNGLGPLSNRLILDERLKLLQENPFDPKTEVSADAKHVAGKIVSHLWTIFVLLPIVLTIIYEVLK